MRVGDLRNATAGKTGQTLQVSPPHRRDGQENVCGLQCPSGPPGLSVKIPAARCRNKQVRVRMNAPYAQHRFQQHGVPFLLDQTGHCQDQSLVEEMEI